MARYKVKFSPDKVDVMVTQAVSLVADMDKELNNYVMKAKEWYGWHFLELAKLLEQDNTSYIQTILTMGELYTVAMAECCSVSITGKSSEEKNGKFDQ